jgi:hypothetical protein
MKTSGGWEYILPFSLSASGVPAPKNINRRCAGLHHAIKSGVRARTFFGNTSAAMLAPSPLARVCRKPAVTD